MLEKIISEHGVRFDYLPGEVIFSQGQKEESFLVLIEGLVKLTYITYDGNEFIKSFVTPMETFGSMASLIHDEVSTFSAKAIEKSLVYKIPKKIIVNLIGSSPEFLNYTFNILVKLAIKKERREYELLCLNEEERYVGFMSSKHELAKRITQVDMARFLGMTPVGLSRIKARIKRTKSL